MNRMTDGDALFANVIADPDDDTVRLVYADWLGENGQPDRGELIRVQVEMAAIRASGGGDDSQKGDIGTLLTDHGYARLRNRDEELREAHPEWDSVLCQECHGLCDYRDTHLGRAPACHTCRGTLDMLVRYHQFDEPTSMVMFEARPHGWRRGFVESVEIGGWETWQPTQASGYTQYVPSRYAKALVDVMPMLRELELTAAVPGLSLPAEPRWYSGGPQFVWERDMSGYAGFAPVEPRTSVLPGWLFDLLEGGTPLGYYFMLKKHDSRAYATARDAKRNLFRTLCRWVRETPRE